MKEESIVMWRVILALKQFIASCKDDVIFLSVKTGSNPQIEINKSTGGNEFLIYLTPLELMPENYILSKPFGLDVIGHLELKKEEVEFLKLYLPFALLPFYSLKYKKCFAISHFAQTLDARIATCSGESKWIGNEQNLIHAHRMRALCDAIMIGSKTLSIDNPRLNVRLVEGKNPIKVILGGENMSFKGLSAIDETSIVFCRHKRAEDILGEQVVITKKSNFETSEILNQLYQRGIHSVYIEGGSFTTSSFLNQGSLDQIQLHISAKILGSGTSSIAFEGISNMSESITFLETKFVNMGDEIMFIGNIR